MSIHLCLYGSSKLHLQSAFILLSLSDYNCIEVKKQSDFIFSSKHILNERFQKNFASLPHPSIELCACIPQEALFFNVFSVCVCQCAFIE